MASRNARETSAATPKSAAPDTAPTIEDYEEVLEDHRRLVRELDVLLNGEHGAAKQASLCDIVGQVRAERLSLWRGPLPLSIPPNDWIAVQAANLSASKARNDVGALAWNMAVAFRRWAERDGPQVPQPIREEQ